MPLDPHQGIVDLDDGFAASRRALDLVAGRCLDPVDQQSDVGSRIMCSQVTDRGLACGSSWPLRPAPARAWADCGAVDPSQHINCPPLPSWCAAEDLNDRRHGARIADLGKLPRGLVAPGRFKKPCLPAGQQWTPVLIGVRLTLLLGFVAGRSVPRSSTGRGTIRQPSRCHAA